MSELIVRRVVNAEVAGHLNLPPPAFVASSVPLYGVVGGDNDLRAPLHGDLHSVLVLLLQGDALGDDAEQTLEVEIPLHVIEDKDLRVGPNGLIRESLVEAERLAVQLGHALHRAYRLHHYPLPAATVRVIVDRAVIVDHCPVVVQVLEAMKEVSQRGSVRHKSSGKLVASVVTGHEAHEFVELSFRAYALHVIPFYDLV